MLKQNTYTKGVLWMMLFNIIARSISFILGIILARQFLPKETDVYLYVWGIINVAIMIVSSVNLMVVGPAYILSSEKESEESAGKICSAFMNFYLVPLILFSVITLFLPYFTYDILSGFSPDQLKPYGGMLRFSGTWMLLVVLNLFLGNLFMSRKYFVIYILGQVVAAIVTLLFILVLKKEIGIDSFFIGQLAGNLVCFVFYIFFIRSRLNIKLKLFYFKISNKIIRETGAVLIISIPTMVVNFLLVYYLSYYEPGQLSAYNYGSALANLPDVIFLSQFVSVFGVRFAEIVAKGGGEDFFRTFRHYGNHLFFFMGGVAIITSLASPAIISTVYGKEGLKPAVFESSILCLSLLAAALPFKALDVMNNRLFASIQALSSLVRFTFPIKLFNIALLIIMQRVYGFEGLLIHQVVMPVIMNAVQFILLRRFFSAAKVQSYFFQIMILLISAALVYTGAQYALSSLLQEMSPYLQMLLITLFVLVMGVVIEKVFRLTQFHTMLLQRGSQILKKLFEN